MELGLEACEDTTRNLSQLDGQSVTVIDKHMRGGIHYGAKMGILCPPYRDFSPTGSTLVTESYIECRDFDHPSFNRWPGQIYSPYFQLDFHMAFVQWREQEIQRLREEQLDFLRILPRIHVVRTPSDVIYGNEALVKHLKEKEYNRSEASALRRMASMLDVDLGEEGLAF